MSLRILQQDTPNPNAKKFILAKDVKTTGKASFSHPAECLNVPMAANLLCLVGVSQVHFFENVLTITQDGSRPWPEMAADAERIMRECMPTHDPNFATDNESQRSLLSPELQEIEHILDRTIRPGLQADGGDLQVLELNDSLLTVRYEGACGSCPSAQAGTLQAIEGILRDEYHPDIRVEAI